MRLLLASLLAATTLSSSAFAQISTNSNAMPFGQPSSPLTASEKAAIAEEAASIRRARAESKKVMTDDDVGGNELNTLSEDAYGSESGISSKPVAAPVTSPVSTSTNGEPITAVTPGITSTPSTTLTPTVKPVAVSPMGSVTPATDIPPAGISTPAPATPAINNPASPAAPIAAPDVSPAPAIVTPAEPESNAQTGPITD